MNQLIISGPELPGIPWEDRPSGCKAPLWRYSANPVIQRDLLPTSNSIFNSAVVPFRDGFAGVFRCDDTNRRMALHVGFSKDGFKWDICPDVLRFEGACPEVGAWVYGYDPRVTLLDDKYWVTWCNGYHGPTIGVAWTEDFVTFHQLENAFLPYNRNGVLFPRKIGGRYAMLSRRIPRKKTACGPISSLWPFPSTITQPPAVYAASQPMNRTDGVRSADETHSAVSDCQSGSAVPRKTVPVSGWRS